MLADLSERLARAPKFINDAPLVCVSVPFDVWPRWATRNCVQTLDRYIYV